MYSLRIETKHRTNKYVKDLFYSNIGNRILPVIPLQMLPPGFFLSVFLHTSLFSCLFLLNDMNDICAHGMDIFQIFCQIP